MRNGGCENESESLISQRVIEQSMSTICVASTILNFFSGVMDGHKKKNCSVN